MSEKRWEESILAGFIRASTTNRSETMKTGDELKTFGFSIDHSEMYKDFTGGDLFFQASVGKTKQAIDLFVPRLVPGQPRFLVDARSIQDPVKRARAQLAEQYINYGARETNLMGHLRNGVIQTLLYGEGPVWIGYHKRSGIVQPVFDTYENLLKDCDAYCQEDMNWVIRRRQKPKWEVMARFPKSRGVIDAMTGFAQRKSDLTQKTVDHGTDLCEFYEVWVRVGLKNYRNNTSTEATHVDVKPPRQGEDPGATKYVCTKDGKILWEGDWEVPLWRVNRWPYIGIQFCQRPGSVLAVAPLESGLPHQKALNWLYTLYLSRMRVTTRTLFAIMEINGVKLAEDDVEKALHGTALEFIKFRVKAGRDDVKIGDYLQKLDMTAGVQEFDHFMQIVGREYEQATGLYEILHSGEMDRQPRSAAEVQMRTSNSTFRLNDMRREMQRICSDIGRQWAMTARFLEDPEDVAELFGPQAGMLWGRIMPPQDQLGDPYAVDWMQWSHETDFTVDTDSMSSVSVEDQVELLTKQNETVNPVLLQSQQPLMIAAAMDNIAAQYRKMGIDDQLVKNYQDIAAFLRQQFQQQQVLAREQQALQQRQMQMQLMQSMQPPQPQMPPQAPQGAPVHPPLPALAGAR